MPPAIADAAREDVLADNTDVAVEVARAVGGLRFEQVDAESVEAAKKLVLDVLGAGIAGAFEDGCVEVQEFAAEVGGRPEATLFPGGLRVPAQNAVAANATACRALEFDDVSERALIHVTATVVPVALAAAEAAPRPVPGREFLAAVVAGIDLANRLSLAPRLSLSGPGYKPRGMSHTYQVGTFAAAAVWAKLHGADEVAMLHALGMAYSQAAGNQQCLLDGALAIRVQQGLSASNGIVAARLALRGVTGPIHPLEGRFGYYPIYYGSYDRTAITDGLGSEYLVREVSIKPYPCGKYTHTAVAAAIDAYRHPAYARDRLRRVVLYVDNEEYYSVVVDPIDLKRRPPTPYHAMTSMPYAVAVALTRGEVVLDDFRPEALTDADVLRVASLIDVIVGRPEGDISRQALPTPGIVELHLTDGSVFRTRADYAPGHPRNPMSWEEVEAKFRRCVAFPRRPLPTVAADELVSRLRRLEELEDMRSLVPDFLVW